jgi:hypothetical protein
MERDPEAAAALYESDGTYQVTPFQEPLRGRKAIFDYWAEVARTQEGIRSATGPVSALIRASRE